MQVIIANIIDFIASMVQIWSGVEKKKAIIFLTVYVAVCVAAIAVKFIVSGIV